MGTKPNTLEESFFNGLEMELLEGKATNVRDKILNAITDPQTGSAIEISEKTAKYLKLLALAYKDTADFDKSTEHLKTLIEYFSKKKDEKNNSMIAHFEEQLGDCHLICAINYGHQSNFKEAVDNLEKANDFITQPEKKAKYELTLGIIYYNLGYYSEALQGVEKAKGFYKQVHERIEVAPDESETRKLFVLHGLISCEHMLGLIKLDGPEKDGALFNLNEALKMAEKIKRVRLLGYIYQSLGRYHLEKEKPDTDEAKKFLENSLTIRKGLYDKKGEAYILLYQGVLAAKLTKWKDALHKFEEAKQEADKIDSIEISIKACLWLHKAFARIGYEKEANLAYKNYDDLTKVEFVKKEKNKAQMEKLFPETTLKTNLKKSKEVMALLVRFIDLIIPPDAKKISSHHIKKDALKTINALRSDLKLKIDDHFNQEEIPLKSFLNAIIESLTEAANPCPPALPGNNWIGTEKVLRFVYESFSDEHLVEKNTWDVFKNIFINGCQRDVQRIKWLGTEQMLATFIKCAITNKQLNKKFSKQGHKRIKAMFVSESGKEFDSIRNCISFDPFKAKTKQDERFRHEENLKIINPIFENALKANQLVMP